jgi:hypothetical protein
MIHGMTISVCLLVYVYFYHEESSIKNQSFFKYCLFSTPLFRKCLMYLLSLILITNNVYFVSFCPVVLLFCKPYLYHVYCFDQGVQLSR